MDSEQRLDDLLRALFQDDGELRRFLVLLGLSIADLIDPATKISTRSDTASQVAKALTQRGLASDALFAALEERAPDRREDIREVARSYADASVPASAPQDESQPEADASPNPTSSRPTDIPEQFKTFLAQLEQELSEIEPPNHLREVESPDRWPWVAAASVLGCFRPSELRPLDASIPRLTALEALSDVVFTNLDGQWVLQDDVRLQCLERLRGEGGLPRALRTNAHIPDRRRDLMERLLHGWAPRVSALAQGELEDILAVVGWLQAAGEEVTIGTDVIQAALERRVLIEPLRKLVGSHFRGRADEIATVHDHIIGDGIATVLLVRGPGGSGKSTLIGKVLIDLEESFTTDPVSFAYIDFDRASHDPNNPASLLQQIARQLRLLYTATSEAAAFAAFESLAAGTDVTRASELLDIDPDLDLSQMIHVLAGRLIELEGSRGRAPLVLILDTFEEVQMRGPGMVERVVDLLSRLQAAMPSMRTIVCGRGDVAGFGSPPLTRTVTLGDLDEVAADAVLQRFGVEDQNLRSLIANRFGRNPLTLRLAAEALLRTKGPELAFTDELARADVLANVAREQVQGMLYSRILGHIGDPEVVKIAHPGLAVRLVTAELIREVLAIPCGLDPSHAQEIFERLRLEVTMFEPEEPDALRHRQDVRRLMLKTILDEPRRAEQVSDIHRRAVAYYAARPGAPARAEQLYHRLMSGEDPRSLSEHWDSSLRNYLVSALEDPLPPAARTWLKRRLGLEPLEGSEVWDQEDWEAAAASIASSWLESGEYARVMAVLSERPERLPGSHLFALEVGALLASGEVTLAAEVLDRGLRSATDADAREAQLELAEQAITVHERRGDHGAMAAAARSVAALCDLTGQDARAVGALTRAVAALPSSGPEKAKLTSDLSARFTRLSRGEMQAQPELVRRVLRTAGQEDARLLMHAATEVGDQTDPARGVFNDDAFILRRLLDQTSDAASASLGALAGELGLGEQDWDLGELASRAVRFGRTGQAVAVGLDFADDEAAARHLVADFLIHPANPQEP